MLKNEGPQVIARNWRRAVVVVDAEDEWLRGELPHRFAQRILPVDGAVADEWGRVVARHDSLGRPIHAMDALIGATAQVHALTLVTRNASDFEVSVKSVVNPWK